MMVNCFSAAVLLYIGTKIRSGRGGMDSSELMLQQIEHLREATETLQVENTRLAGELAGAQSRNRHAHNQLAEELTRSLGAQHAAMSALRRLEQYCRSHGLSIRDASLVSYEVSL